MTSANPFDNLKEGRGWLNRAAEMLDGCEDHVSDAEFATAAAAIGSGFVRLAAAEREAAAQTFVDVRHATERAADLERIAAARTADLERIEAADAKVWAHQESEAEAHAAVVEAHKAMTARMQAEKALLDDVGGAALAEGIKRELRAAAEARPHDDEPGSLADRLIAIANAVYGNDTRHVLDAPTGHGLAAVVRTLADGPLIQTEWAAAQFTKLAFELETAGEATDRG